MGGANPFLTYEWCRTWLKHFGKHYDWTVLACYDGKACAGIMPIMKKRGLLPSPVRFAGSECVKSDYLDCLSARGEQRYVQAMLDYLFRTGKSRWLVLDNLTESATCLPALRCTLIARGLPHTIFTVSASPYIELMGSYDHFRSTTSKSLRQTLRNARSRLSREGRTSLFERSQSLSDGVFREMTALHSKRQTGRVGPSVFQNPMKAAFLSEVCERFANRGWLDVSTLRIDGALAAYVLGFVFRNTYFYWYVCSSPDFASFSPGKLLLDQLIEKCFEQRFARFDFMIGMEPYKLQWTGKSELYYRADVYPNALCMGAARVQRQFRDKIAASLKANSTAASAWVSMSKWVRK